MIWRGYEEFWPVLWVCSELGWLEIKNQKGSQMIQVELENVENGCKNGCMCVLSLFLKPVQLAGA